MLSYRKLAMRVLGRPLHTGGGNDSPRPASQRAAAFILTAAMLTSLTAPAFADTWDIEKGDITISAGETEGTNKVIQGETINEKDTNTIITGKSDKNTVTIEAKDKNDKVEVTLDNVNIKADSGSALTSEGDVTLTLKGDNSLTGGISDNGSYGRYGINSNGSLTITGGETDRLTAQGGSGTYDGGSGIYSNSLTLSGGTVNANGGKSGGRGDGGYGIHSGSLTISGSTVNATGGNGSNDGSSSGGSGIHIFSNGSLTVSDGTVTATGGNGGTGDASDGGNGISGKGSLTVSGGTVNAIGGSSGNSDFSDGGSGINIGDVTVSGGTVTATGGNGGTGKLSDGGSGISIDSRSGSLTVSDGTVNANGGNGGSGDRSNGGSGISNGGSLTVSGGTVNANGGNSGNGYDSDGGRGIANGGSLTVSGGTVNANGGNCGTGKESDGGDGIHSGSLTISNGTVNANGGGNGYFLGGNGISSSDSLTISGGTVNATGGNSVSGGDGIHSGSSIELSGSLELTAKAGKGKLFDGKALSQKGSELDLNAIDKEKLAPGAKVTTIDADGETKEVSIPVEPEGPVIPVEPEGPVIPEESSSSSDGGSATPSAPASTLPGLTVTDKSGAVIDSISTQSGNTLTICAGRFTASLRASLATLRQLRAEGIDTITFQTILCSTTLSVDELLAMGGEDAEAVLTHRLTASSLTVG